MTLNTMKKTSLACMLGLLVAAPLVFAQTETDAGASQAAYGWQPHTYGLVETVIDSVSKYHSVQAAINDGYVQATGCVSGETSGGMGVHYARLDRIGDGVLDPENPELLVYEPKRGGRLELVAVDYLILKSGWEEKNGEGVPAVLAGQHMMLAGEPNRYALPSFYLLHVWAFKHNSNGMFAMYNPDVTCEFYEPEEG